MVKVSETAVLASDLREYVLTPQLADAYAKVLRHFVDAATPATQPSDRIGVWVSGFFGSGKSHFVKLLGHLLANTATDEGPTRDAFRRLLDPQRPGDGELAELLQQADTYRLDAHLVPFDITVLQGPVEQGAAMIFRRAFYESLGLSRILSFAEVELRLRREGRYQEFIDHYAERYGSTWEKDRNFHTSIGRVATVLRDLYPAEHSSDQAAVEALRHIQEEQNRAPIESVAHHFATWVREEAERRRRPTFLVFVADEVGAWTARQYTRIEQIRALVESFARLGEGRLWLVATSQERLSDVIHHSGDVAHHQAPQAYLERLEARFPINVHLESSEVGTVIENRILRKRPTARPELEQLWAARQGILADIADTPGIQLEANYPRPDRDAFVRDYPFLPYQLPAAADIFGAMRGAKVSPGARSMLKVALDATSELADRALGVVVSWDQIFDSANQDNEFAGEGYLGSQGLEVIRKADRDLGNRTPLPRPSRLLKTLWLTQQSRAIARTSRTLARLLVDDLNTDVLALERSVEATLHLLAEQDLVRQDPATGQWRFLTPDEVTVERLIRTIADELPEQTVREERLRLVGDHLRAMFPGRLTLGRTNTTFRYGLLVNEIPFVNQEAPVQLKIYLAETVQSRRIEEEYASYLSEPTVAWVIDLPERLSERLRRAIAIERLESDDRFGRIATDRTREEARRLRAEADELRGQAGQDVDGALQSGRLYWAGKARDLAPGAARSTIEAALADRLTRVYHRFSEADRPFRHQNIERLFSVPPSERSALDHELGLFDADGHVLMSHPVVDELARYLTSTARTDGGAIVDHFARPPFGWPTDVLRYAAAALFVDGKATLVDRNGRRYENPREAAARALFGPGPFRQARLEIEERPLSPEEISAVRALLSDVGHETHDSSELTVAEALDRFVAGLAEQLAVTHQAEQAGLPLPERFGAIDGLIRTLRDAGARDDRIRAALAHQDALRSAVADLRRLAEFVRGHGLQDFTRSRRLLQLALDAGLADDQERGAAIAEARDQMEALLNRRHVLDEWVAWRNAASAVAGAYRSAYQELYGEVQRRVAEARRLILESPDFAALGPTERVRIEQEFLGAGRPLAELEARELGTEDDLIRASASFTIAHLRAMLAGLDGAVSAAQQRMIELLANREEAPAVTTWNPRAFFAGKEFRTEADVDDAFAEAAEEVRRLVREGKTVRVV